LTVEDSLTVSDVSDFL